jgi:hypothetical protein
MNLKRYVSELTFHAALAQPYEVSQAEFVAIVALLTDGTDLTMQERADVQRFVAEACEMAAGVDPSAADAVSIHKAACKLAGPKAVDLSRLFGEG